MNCVSDTVYRCNWILYLWTRTLTLSMLCSSFCTIVNCLRKYELCSKMYDLVLQCYICGVWLSVLAISRESVWAERNEPRVNTLGTVWRVNIPYLFMSTHVLRVYVCLSLFVYVCPCMSVMCLSKSEIDDVSDWCGRWWWERMRWRLGKWFEWEYVRCEYDSMIEMTGEWEWENEWNGSSYI